MGAIDPLDGTTAASVREWIICSKGGLSYAILNTCEAKSMKAENAVPILRELIENGRLSQRQLADRCGLSLGTVNHVVNRAIKKNILNAAKRDFMSPKPVSIGLYPIR